MSSIRTVARAARADRRRWTRLALLAGLLAALVVPTFGAMEPAGAAADVEMTLSEVNPVQFVANPPLHARGAGEVPAADCVQVKVGYRVLVEDLHNAVVTVQAPANRWRTYIAAGVSSRTPSGVPAYTDTPSNDIVNGVHEIEFDLGTITAGPTASFDFLLCTLQWTLMPGDVAGIDAVLSGDEGASTSQHLEFTVVGASNPDVGQSAVSIVDDNTYGTGYAISWDTTLFNGCAVSPTTYGCTPFEGSMTTLLPIGSRFMGAHQEWPIPANFGFPSTGGRPEAFEADGSQNLVGFPALGTLITAGNQTATFDAFAFPNGTCLGANGQGPAQGSPPEPAPADCRGNWSSNTRPRYRVTVWVPVPVTSTDYVVGASATGDDGESDTAPNLTMTVNAGPTITFQKDSLPTTSSGFAGSTCGTTPYNPSTAVANSSCQIPKQGVGLFRETLTTDAPIHDAYIADKLPSELVFVSTDIDPDSAAQATPNQWQVYYSNDAGCQTSDDAPNDPDWYLGPPSPAASSVRCVHWHTETMNTFESIVVIRASVAPGVIEDPGDWMYSTNLGEAGGANVSGGSETDDAVHTLLNRLSMTPTGSFSPSPATPGGETVMTLQGVQSDTSADFGAVDWHISATLPADGSITFVPNGMSGADTDFTSLPFNPTSASPLPTVCDAFDGPTRTMTCHADGTTSDAVTGLAQVFRARMRVHVRLGTVVPGKVTVCTWNGLDQPYDPPLDGAGEPIGYFDTPTRKRCTDVQLSVVGNPTVEVQKSGTPSGAVERGDTIDYDLDYRHLPGSVIGLTNAYVYDFIGRHPLTGSLLGDIAPAFAGVDVGAEPVVVQYTCDALPVGNPTVGASSMTWGGAPCGNGTSDVTAVRFRLDYGASPGDFPLLTDPTDESSALQSGSVSLSVTVPADAADGETVGNMASMASPQIQSATLPASAVVTNEVSVPPNLTIEKKAQSPGFLRDHDGIYTLTVSSTDAASAAFTDDVVVTDVLPAYLTFQSVTGTGWSCITPAVGSSGTVTCTSTTDVDPGASLPPLTLTVGVTGAAPDPAVNTASVSPGGSDDGDDSDTESVPVADPPPDPIGPTAVDDATSTTINQPVAVDVPDNDEAGDNPLDLTSVSITVDPAHGSVVVDPTTGVVTYTPDPGHIGTDELTYEICDSIALCDTAVVRIQIPYDLPTAVDDHRSGEAGTPIDVVVLDNDDAPAGFDPASVQILQDPLNGTVTVAADGSVTYTPAPGFLGPDDFEYRMCDVNGFCDDAHVWITVILGSVVTAPGSPAGGGEVLAFTGGSSQRMALLGVALVVVGGGAWAATRRRRVRRS